MESGSGEASAAELLSEEKLTSSKINSAVASIFTATYLFYWPTCFPNTPLKYPPTFDSRVVLYPGEKEVRDYFSWRQADSTFSFSLS